MLFVLSAIDSSYGGDIHFSEGSEDSKFTLRWARNSKDLWDYKQCETNAPMVCPKTFYRNYTTVKKQKFESALKFLDMESESTGFMIGLLGCIGGPVGCLAGACLGNFAGHVHSEFFADPSEPELESLRLGMGDRSYLFPGDLEKATNIMEIVKERIEAKAQAR